MIDRMRPLLPDQNMHGQNYDGPFFLYDNNGTTPTRGSSPTNRYPPTIPRSGYYGSRGHYYDSSYASPYPPQSCEMESPPHHLPIEPGLVIDNNVSLIQPHENDVLMGRGGKNNQHSGNETLRVLARSYCSQYRVSSKKGKSAISREIVQRMRDLKPPARFLKRDMGTGGWVDVGDDIAREKASQVLRDAVSLKPEQEDNKLPKDHADPSAAVLNANLTSTDVDDEQDEECTKPRYSPPVESGTTAQMIPRPRPRYDYITSSSDRSGVSSAHRTLSSPHGIEGTNGNLHRPDYTPSLIRVDDSVHDSTLLPPPTPLESSRKRHRQFLSDDHPDDASHSRRPSPDGEWMPPHAPGLDGYFWPDSSPTSCPTIRRRSDGPHLHHQRSGLPPPEASYDEPQMHHHSEPRQHYVEETSSIVYPPPVTRDHPHHPTQEYRHSSPHVNPVPSQHYQTSASSFVPPPVSYYPHSSSQPPASYTDYPPMYLASSSSHSQQQQQRHHHATTSQHYQHPAWKYNDQARQTSIASISSTGIGGDNATAASITEFDLFNGGLLDDGNEITPPNLCSSSSASPR